MPSEATVARNAKIAGVAAKLMGTWVRDDLVYISPGVYLYVPSDGRKQKITSIATATYYARALIQYQEQEADVDARAERTERTEHIEDVRRREQYEDIERRIWSQRDARNRVVATPVTVGATFERADGALPSRGAALGSVGQADGGAPPRTRRYFVTDDYIQATRPVFHPSATSEYDSMRSGWWITEPVPEGEETYTAESPAMQWDHVFLMPADPMEPLEVDRDSI